MSSWGGVMADGRLTTRALAVRLDSDGDVLLAGPALRQLRADVGTLHLLVSPSGAEAAGILPGVDRVLVADVPWIRGEVGAGDPEILGTLLEELRAGRYDEVVILTSFHQSPLPMALLARWAGVPKVVGTSDDYPGSLLDVRHHRLATGDDTGFGGGHEVEAMRAVVAAAGHPRVDSGGLRVRHGAAPAELGNRYVVVHPTASAPSRAIGAERAADYARALDEAGWAVVVTGGPGEEAVGRCVTPRGGTDLTGRISLEQLAAVLSGASAVVVGNTGPAHLAAAVGTPVVSIFSPVVPAERWAPYGVPHVVLGDQQAPCAMSRARTCPVPGHPCTDVTAREVVEAVAALTTPVPATSRQPRLRSPRLLRSGAS
jgi:ADP-heptose:LPS heptosyltransferase